MGARTAQERRAQGPAQPRSPPAWKGGLLRPAPLSVDLPWLGDVGGRGGSIEGPNGLSPASDGGSCQAAVAEESPRERGGVAESPVVTHRALLSRRLRAAKRFRGNR